MRLYPDSYGLYSSSAFAYLFDIPVCTDVQHGLHILHEGWQFILTQDEHETFKEHRVTTVDAHSNMIQISGVDLLYEHTPDKVVKAFLPVYEKLLQNIHPHIWREVEAVSATWNKDFPVISMHIRTWFDEQSRNSKYFDLGFYTDMIECHPDHKVFLACDCNETKARLLCQYPDRIIVYKHRDELLEHTYTTQSQSQIEDAMIEMLLLGKNPVLVGSFLSSFTENPYWFHHVMYGQFPRVFINYPQDHPFYLPKS